MAPFGRSGSSTGRQGSSRGPQIYVPPNHPSTPLLPDLKKFPKNPGYTDAHAVYEQMRNHFQSKAFSQGNTQTIIVQCWLARMEPKKQKQTLIHDIFAVIPNIPVSIGARDLKAVVYHALLPQIIRWLRGYDVSEIEFSLRKQHWIEIIPSGYPDVNAIADDFFTMKPAKTGGSTRIFSNKNPAKLYLAIDNPTFDKIADFFDKLDNPDRDNLHIDETSYPPKKGKKAMTQRKPRATRGKKSVAGDETEKSENQDALDMSQSLPRNPEVLKSTNLYRRATPPPGPVQKKPRLELMVSPDASNIKKALAQQSQPRTKALKGLFDNTTCDVLIYILPTATWTEAIKNPHIFSELKNIIPCHNVIYYNTKSQRTSGGFKTAIPGKLGTQIFDAEKRDVCLKQAFSLAENGQKVIHAPISQLSFLGGELNILGWATTMMDIVYRYIKIQEPDVGTPPFHVPLMRFVRGGLAICQNETRETYLVEEWIDGEFVKYIHNRSGQPRHFQNEEYDLRARFLSFCQHVQFYKTDKAAYVSDFQGQSYSFIAPYI
ncbi:hypothetical protein MSAN_00874100 [Mycena sanguinolenta]|uniref:Alpha-type protein kinase domain-containing protein n=1 Tax=Mycena sanguinolenta TaxID=230812 RepID=A0A8H7DB90_9AGAR|nr:hypothetical protein MSAN_00874100 [Mycena sanguinolenta]